VGRRTDAGARGAARKWRVAVGAIASARWALAVAPLVPSEASELVAIVSLARLVPLLEVELPNESSLLALVDGEGRVLARAGKPPGGARSNRSTSSRCTRAVRCARPSSPAST
jgi:hypothetical protein